MKNKTSERLPYYGEGSRCRRCTLWTGYGCMLPTCSAGEGHYFSTVKLWGTKEEYIEYQSKYDTYGLAGEVWDWTEKAIREGNGKYYLKICFEYMDQFLGNRDEWPDVKETIMRLGPDSYQLEVEREKTDSIFQLWWHLVKYQYNKRHNGKGRKSSLEKCSTGN